MKLTSMKLPSREPANTIVATDAPEGPRYPYGLSLQLDDDTLGKLGLSLPTVGKSFLLQARVKVTGAMEAEHEGGTKVRNASLQIEDMGLGPDEGEGSSAADKLYDGK